MRPAKWVLLFCADDVRRSELSFVLHIRNGYVVADLDIAHTPDLAIVVYDPETSEWASRHIAKRFPEVPILVLMDKNISSLRIRNHVVTKYLASESNIEILEWVHVTAARKHGPKSAQRKPVANDSPLFTQGEVTA